MQTQTLHILESINRMCQHTEIFYDDLSEFEKLIVNKESIELIRSYVTSHENIIYDQNMLCNNYFKKKFNTHPVACNNIVCHKTPVYYGLWLSCYYYQQIFYRIKLLAKLSTKEIVSDFLSFFYSLPCVCHEIINYKNYYDHTDMNFLKVNMFLTLKMKELFSTYEDYKINMMRESTINVSKFNIMTDCVSDRIVKLDFIQDEINNYDKISSLICELLECWESYDKICTITKYLFGVESYEYYMVHLNYRKLEIDKSLDRILSNKFSDINFNKNYDENILYNTMKVACKSELLIAIINNGGKLPPNKNLFTMFENNECNIENIKIFLKHYDAKYFSNDSLLTILKQNLLKTHKIDIVNIFASRGLLSNAIKILLESDDSYNILLNLYKSDDVVVSRISIDDAMFCVKLEKYKELDLILSHNKSFSNEIYNNSTPVMIAIKENKLKFLQLFLHHGADPFASHNGVSPIMLAILENRLDMLEFLLENWIKECSTSDSTSHIILAIKEDNIDVLNLLLKYASIDGTIPVFYAMSNNKLTAFECLLIHFKESLNFMMLNNSTPLMTAIDSSKLVAFELLLKYGANPYSYVNGLNILHYALVCNQYDFVQLLKDDQTLINSLTICDNRHPIFLAVDTHDPIKFTDLLLQNTEIKCNHTLDNNSNILNYILISSHQTEIKISLFRRYIRLNVNLTNEVDGTPLVVSAAENNMYDIVIMIMNKLIEIEEISIAGYTNRDNNIIDIIKKSQNKKIQITSSNKSITNYYSLVLIYLSSKKEETINFKKKINLNWNMLIIVIAIILVKLLSSEQKKNSKHNKITETEIDLYYDQIFFS